jgi:hypothetical protein
MHTSLIWMALVTAAPAEKASLEWLTDYGQAQRQGQAQERPQAVFLAPGKDGWKKLVTAGQVSSEALEELSAGYVCLHLDTATEYGKKWAQKFDMPSGLGLVLSDRAGEIQAFRHEGSLSSSTLTGTLERYSGKVIRRTSYYPAESVNQSTTQGRTVIYGTSPGTTRSTYCPT